MITTVEKKDCNGCHACYSVCPKKCIKMVEDTEGFLYPEVDINECANCNLCEKVCLSLQKTQSTKPMNVYACKHRNINIRKSSSSGGVFSAVAEHLTALSKDTVVFGAELNKNFQCSHSYALTRDEYNKFRGSKYIQSVMGDSYILAKKFLNDGRQVLFTGCPCQIKGLRLFLGKEYDNLFCVDLICHGVPSYKVLAAHIKSLEIQHDSKIMDISFRTKSAYWKLFPLGFNLENGNRCSNSIDGYMQGFLKNLYLRPSCYNCKTKNFNSGSDMTIADYWGVKSKFPKFDDELGVSLVLVNTEKGAKIFGNMNNIEYRESSIEHVLKTQHHLTKSASKNKNRELFFEELERGESFSSLSAKFINKSLIYSIKSFLGPRYVEILKKIVYRD